MGNNQSHSLPKSIVYEIVDATDFTPQQVHRLYDRFQRLDKSETGYLTREDFLRIPELAINPLAERIIDMFLIDSQNPSLLSPENSEMEVKPVEQINFPEFCKMLANFNGKTKHHKSDEEHDSSHVETSKDRKLRFLFRLYDSNNDGVISKEELLSLLRLMVGTNISSQQLDLIAQRTIAETDQDNDGSLTFSEFKNGLENVDIEMKMTVRFNE